MTCKDCYHYKVCGYHIDEETDLSVDECLDFKDKSKIIELPCNVGDTVFVPWKYEEVKGIGFAEIESFKIYTSDNIPIFFLEDFESDIEMCTHFTKDDIGETVFLTRDEAEAKLKEMNEQ